MSSGVSTSREGRRIASLQAGLLVTTQSRTRRDLTDRLAAELADVIAAVIAFADPCSLAPSTPKRRGIRRLGDGHHLAAQDPDAAPDMVRVNCRSRGS
jgi:hypothetical protein